MKKLFIIILAIVLTVVVLIPLFAVLMASRENGIRAVADALDNFKGDPNIKGNLITKLSPEGKPLVIEGGVLGLSVNEIRGFRDFMIEKHRGVE